MPPSAAAHSFDLTYVTIADSRYFPGAVALVNSLHLTGNPGPIVVLDAGLAPEQRALLATHCDVRPVPVDRSGTLPFYFKPTIAMLEVGGVVVYLDSDMIVTAPLAPVVTPAAQGRFCAFPDVSCLDRRCPEWAQMLGLRADLREQTYLQAGFVAFDVDIWRADLNRWWELCDVGRLKRTDVAWGIEDPDLVAADPLFWGDQDVLNALLMSEVDEERVAVLDAGLVGVSHWPDEARAQVVDRRTLATVEDGRRLALLHYWDFPKPWLAQVTDKLPAEAYVELMARLLTAKDVPVRLQSAAVPWWLRDGAVARGARHGTRLARRGAGHAMATVRDSLGSRARRIGRKLLSREAP